MAYMNVLTAISTARQFMIRLSNMLVNLLKRLVRIPFFFLPTFTRRTGQVGFFLRFCQVCPYWIGLCRVLDDTCGHG